MKSRNSIIFFNILSTVLLTGISIFTAPLFSRMLGDHGYGIVSIYTTWVSLIAILFTLQTQQTIVHARSTFPEIDQPKYQSSILGLSCMVYLACSVVVVLCLERVSLLLKLDKVSVLLMLFHAFGFYCVGFINNKFAYEYNAKQNFLLSVGTSLTTILMSMAFILYFPDSMNHYGRILGLSLVYGTLGIGVCIYIFGKGKLFYNKEYWKFCVPLAVPLVFQCLSDLLLGHSDRVMIQQMIDSAAVGQYSLAYSFSGILHTLFMALNNSWCPFFYDAMKKNEREYINTISTNFLELFTVLAVGFLLLGREVYHIFANEEFWLGTDLIFLLAASNYATFLCTFSINFELYNKKTKTVAMGTFLSMIINIVLNYVLIGYLGIFGAAISTVVSHFIQFGFHYIIASKMASERECPFHFKMYLPFILTFFAVFGIVFLVQDVWWLRWLLGAAIGIFELYRIYRRKTIF